MTTRSSATKPVAKVPSPPPEQVGHAFLVPNAAATAPQRAPTTIANPPYLTWRGLYREVELWKSALRLYTKPLFSWRKALNRSTDQRTLYDFARHGLQNIDLLDRALQRRRFEFRPALALHRNFNGKRRTLYIAPWEERLVHLLLYRLLNSALDGVMSRSSYAYRIHGFGVDRCQSHIARQLRSPAGPRHILKRDIRDFFASVDHDALLEIVRRFVPQDDYLFTLLQQCIQFRFEEAGSVQTAVRGLPFGTPIACCLANLYLLDLDRRLENVPAIHFYRYADDLLVLGESASALDQAETVYEATLSELGLQSKDSHSAKFTLTCDKRTPTKASPTTIALPLEDSFRHLGLQFRADGSIGLSRDKFRKIRNLFRFAFRRYRSRLQRTHDPRRRAAILIRICQERLERAPRHVAIIDYYLRHVTDEKQWRQLDRWLAEEVLSISFGGGHKKGYFRRLPFATLRRMGLPSLLHRGRLIRHGHLRTPFFQWKNQQEANTSEGTAARFTSKGGPSLVAQKHRARPCS